MIEGFCLTINMTMIGGNVITQDFFEYADLFSVLTSIQ